ncbi:MAG TPA: ammonium transporter [Candidatus Thermoplasmatota archaeon]|nr:ammonium transporter [Candidatus Thermoplasmatota archaeon]
MTATAAAQAEAPGLSAGDTAWVLASAALVMLMVPGLALFYGGMVRQKNVLATVMQCFIILAIVSLQWALIGYTLAFGGDVGGMIGDLRYALLGTIAPTDAAPLAPTIPHLAFVFFQMMFAVITPALIVGAFAERFSFRAIILFSLLWATLVYDPVAHWVWGGGFLAQLGALDFAGGTVVHLTAGVAALACVLYVGRRRGFGTETMRPNSLPITMLGAGLLWFGWFGFNAGSALAAGPLAASAFAATHLGAAAASASWVLLEWTRKGKPSAIGAASGLVAGLVAITPASGFVTPMAAILVGGLAGVACYAAVSLMKNVFRLDDTLDAFGVHGVGGAWGALATGLFATTAVNSIAKDGLFATSTGGFGYTASGLGLVGVQLLAVVIVAAYTFVMTLGVLKLVDLAVGLRVPEQVELVGLDLSEHGEAAYSFEVTAPGAAPQPQPVAAGKYDG